MSDKIPCVEVYRHIGLHDYQDPPRIDRVKAQIDRVYAMRDLDELYEYACSFRNPAEPRLFAKARVVAAFEVRASAHESRGNIDMERLNARTVGLDSLTSTDPRRYVGALCDPGARAPGVSRTIDRRPEHHVRRLQEAAQAARAARGTHHRAVAAEE